MNNEETTEYGFHGNLEESAFTHVLRRDGIDFVVKSMEEMDSLDINNPERFESIVKVKGDIPELAKDIFDNHFDCFELESIMDGSYQELE